MTLRAIIWCAVSTLAQAADEKDSLPSQETQALALCDREGWHIVDILRVPGFSRRYTDLDKCARDMRAEGIDAFDRLIMHWEKKDFDVLVCRDGNRFARTQALHARVVEDTIDAGARIYSFADGWVDERNYRMFISMNGYKAAGEIDELVRRREIGYAARAKRGLPVNSKVVSSHKLIRDEKSGKALRVEVDETKRRLWNDAAHLLLNGLPWSQIEDTMFREYGHANPLGEPYGRLYFYRVFYTPSFWGHVARHFKYSKRGPWVFEEGHPIPEGVSINYNVHEPVFTGQLAEKLKAELLRRENIIRGKSKPDKTLKFTGLFVCAECGYSLAYSRSRGYAALHCVTHWDRSIVRLDCSNRRHLSEKRALEYIDRRLREALAKHDLSLLVQDDDDPARVAAQELQQVSREVDDLEKRIRQMILKQASADDAVHDLYDQEINNASVQLRGLKTRLKGLQQQVVETDSLKSAERAFEEIARIGADRFWQQEDRVINQLLHQIMGRRRFAVLDGKIVKVGYAHKQGRRRF